MLNDEALHVSTSLDLVDFVPLDWTFLLGDDNPTLKMVQCVPRKRETLLC